LKLAIRHQSANILKANDNVHIDISITKVANLCSNYENPQIEAMQITAGSKASTPSPLLAIKTLNLWAGGI
jgi:hypothetical protein